MNSKRTTNVMNSRLSALLSFVVPFSLPILWPLMASTARAAPDLDILASAGLGDELGGRAVALDISGDGVVLASELHGQVALVRLDRFGERVGPLRRIAGIAGIAGGVDDLAVDRGTGNIAVIGAAGLTMFDPDFEPLWQHALDTDAPERRVALGERGTVAALAGDTLQIFAADGRVLGQVAPGEDFTRGLAVLDDAGLVIATGWSRRHACDAWVDVASLVAFARDGSPRWQAYGELVATDPCDGEPANTRGVAVARGEDGLVYLLAEADGRDNIFRARPGEPGVDANNVAFDVYTDLETADPGRFAYFARFTPAGRHLLGQYFLLPGASSVVAAREIAADRHGNVYLAGTASHSLGAADEVAVTEPLDRMAGFVQIVGPDFEARRLWRQLEADDMRTDLTALALAGDRVISLLEATPVDGHTEGSLPSGSTVLLWPGGLGPVAAEKRPDPETEGTFGYESGVSGSDPTCYCDADAPATPSALLALAMFGLAGLRRPRRRIKTRARR